jgi:uncharacterized protein
MISMGMLAASFLLPLVVMAQTIVGVSDLRDPRPTTWVVDQAEIIDAEDERVMNDALAALKAEVGPELVVVTVHDVTAASPKAFATELFNTWKLGSAEKNDGVLILMVVKQRRLEIETGDGMQAVLTAAWLSELQRRDMVPFFKAGTLGAGLRVGATSIAQRLRTPPGEQDAPDAAGAYRSDGVLTTTGNGDGTEARSAYSSSSPSDPATATETGPSNTSTALVGLGIMGGVGGAGAFAMRRRSRKCKKCGALRHALSEEADDEHLSAGQRAEEKIGSVDHTILHCEPCGTFEHVARNIFFTRRKECAGCKHRTAVSETNVLKSPTYSSSGTAEVRTTCSFCSHSSSTRHTLAKLTRSSSSSSSSSSSGYRSSSSSSSSSRSSSRSSSSSSSSSSSGGGRSSGGGSGSSW